MFGRVIARRLGAAAPIADLGSACRGQRFRFRYFSQASHPLDNLTAEEIKAAAAAARAAVPGQEVRFNQVTLAEPPKKELVAFAAGKTPAPQRAASVTLVVPSTGRCHELTVSLPDGKVTKSEMAPEGEQPPFSPDDCFLAEEIVKADEGVQKLLKERYGLTDMSLLNCDPWSVHLADQKFPLAQPGEDGVHPRLVQTFLYKLDDADDNHYAHPIDLLPIVDLNKGKVVAVQGTERPAPKIPSTSVNYHRNKVKDNAYLATSFRADQPMPLEITQPQGASFKVDGQVVTWQDWSIRIGWNNREGLVLHDVKYDGRPVLNRASLVEMAVPYGDPHPPFDRKCAFDVGDYGLGYCSNSLKLGCDCLGHIHYFDGMMADSKGEPWNLEKCICMHEEDDGLLWKHVEYRTGHNESRRKRRLVLSFIATVVNYEYLFYWYFMQDGTLQLELKLTGELSTNMLSEGETEPPIWGTMVAPGVNAQNHQHMFCARLDMAVDGLKNSVSEVDIVPVAPGPENPANNAFKAVSRELKTEKEAICEANPNTGRVWKVENKESINPITKEPVSYILIPYTFGPAHPLLLTGPDSAVTKRGEFATKSLWVTPHKDDERYPAGEYTPQSTGGEGLPKWTAADRSVEDTDVVLWHSFGVAHVPRPEDFPVMPCETTGFTLKAHGFFTGNPAIDLAPDVKGKSKCCSD